MKYANSTLLALKYALRSLLRLSDGGEESKRGRITKYSTMIHTSREGLDYYFVEVTGKEKGMIRFEDADVGLPGLLDQLAKYSKGRG